MSNSGKRLGSLSVLFALIAVAALGQPTKTAVNATSLDISLQKTHEPNPTTAPWNLGVPIDYLITLKNVGGAGSSHVSVSDPLPDGFVVTKIQCQATFNAACPLTALAAPTFGEFVMPADDSNITLHISGYYKPASSESKTNLATVIAKDNQDKAISAGSNTSDDDTVYIKTNLLPVDLDIKKTVTPISTQFTAKLHYELKVTNTSAVPIYLGGIMWVRDVPRNDSSIPITWTASGFQCNSSLGTMCPDLYLDANQLPKTVTGTMNSSALDFPFDRAGGLTANDTGLMAANGGTFTIQYDLVLTTNAMCSNGEVRIWNEAFLDLANTQTHITDNNSNNTSTSAKTTITGLLTTCPPPESVPGLIKIATTSGPVWKGNPVSYTVKVTNTRATAMDVQVSDFVSKDYGTPPFTATLLSGPTCNTPGCTLSNVTKPTASVVTNGTEYPLWSGTVKQLAAKQTVQINYTVVFATTCETDKYGDYIQNHFTAKFPDNKSNDAYASVSPEEGDLCTQWGYSKTPKTQTLGRFGDTLEYDVTFRNDASETRTMGTVRDVASIFSDQAYGTVPADYEYTCSVPTIAKVTNGPTSGPPAGGPHPNASINAATHGWLGTKIIDANNVTFEAGAVLTCHVKIKLYAPTGPTCQGKGSPKFVNSALMDASPFYNPNKDSQPSLYETTTVDLPLCRKATVSKIALYEPPAKSPEYGPGASVTYKITVTNTGTDDLAGLTLKDVIEAPLTGVSVKPCTPLPTACSSPPTLTNGVVDVKYAPLKAGQGVTFELTVKAPQAGGSYPNVAKATFLPGGKWYFQGDEARLQEKAHITVLTPKLAKAFSPAKIAASGTSTLTFDITNTISDPAQNGITFTDTLPSGVVITGTPTSNCGGTVSVSADGRSLSLANGSLAAGKHACRVTATVAATGVCGIYRNTKANFTNVANVDVSNVDVQLEVGDCPIGLVVRKIVEGAPAGFQAQFNFSVKCTGTGTSFAKSFTIGWPNPGLTTITGIPAGSQCTVTEGAMPAAPSGLAWATPVYTPAGGVVTVTDKGAEVTVKNVLERQPDCIRIIVSEVSCEVDKNGKPTGAYIWKFRFQNLSGQPISHLYITDLPAPVAALPDDSVAFVPPVTNLSQLVQVTLKNAKPGPLSFTISLQDQGFECCTMPIRLELPPCDCAQIVSESTPSCFYPLFKVPPPYHYTFKLQNLSTLPVDHVFVAAVSPLDHVTTIASSAIKVTKSVHPIATLPPGGVMTTPITVAITGAQAVGGQEVCLNLTLRSSDPNNCCCSIVRCFKLPDCSIHPPDVTTLGDARYTRFGTGFVLEGIGSTGNDGISIALRDARAAELAWLPLDEAGPLPDGAYFELRAAGNSGEKTGSIRVTKAGNEYRIVPSDADRQAHTAEVFENGRLVGSTTAQGVNVVVIWPVAAGVEIVPAGDGETLAFTLGSAEPVAWTLADGRTIAGDRLRLTPVDAGTDAVPLQKLELRAANIPRIEVTGTSIFHDCNGNGVPDAEDVATGASADANGNGRPDECEGRTELAESLNTGFDQVAGTPLPFGELPEGTDDDEWRIVAPGADRPAKVVIDPVWSATLPDTRWISVDPDKGNSVPNTTNLVFQRCFCVAEAAGEIELDLQLRADNDATLYLNGRHIAGPGGAFNDTGPLHLSLSGRVGDGLFVGGRNCLTVDVRDRGVVGGFDLAGTVTAVRGACPP
jgi:uncharacterized repeat protein (TIGR01451 family)